MSDRYLEVTQTPWGSALVSTLGLPKPPRLRRGEGAWAERPLDGRGVAFGASEGAGLVKSVMQALKDAGAQIRVRAELPGFAAVKATGAELGIALAGMPVAGEGVEATHAIVYDASGLARPEALRQLYD